MSGAEYRARILEVEAYCQRLSFLCDPNCPGGDFYAHADIVMRHLSDVVDADYYGVPRSPIETDVPHLKADAARHLAHFDRKWGRVDAR